MATWLLKTEPGTGKHLDRPCFSPYWESQERRNALAQPTKVERARPAKAS